jgi:hypothetical protein
MKEQFMAGCGCGADDKSTAEKVLGLVVCTKTHQCFVTHIVEKALPILFWLGIIGSVIIAFIAAGTVLEYESIFCAILTFLFVLIADIIITLLSFYVIYLLKAIKDSLKDNENECGCGCDIEEAEPTKEVKEEVVAAPKKRGRKPAAK